MSMTGTVSDSPLGSKNRLQSLLILYPFLTVAISFANGDTGHTADSNSNHNSSNNNMSGDSHENNAIVHVVMIHYHNVRDPLIFTCVVLVTALCKVAYHHFQILSSKIPESCILVLLGIAFGAIIEFSGADHDLPTFFSPHQFFLFLLPPITLEAAYSLHDRTLLENLGSILLFAIVGTVAACFIVGLSMFGLAHVGAMGAIVDMGLMEYMVFAALIVAVDPVAVLAVFSEIGVNNVLYFLVFGESLLNDGVTVVLYSVFQELKAMDEIGTTDILLGLARFVVVCVGGLSLGVLAGLLTAVITKHTTHVKVVEPIIIFTVAYLGFLLSELFTFSGIISMIGCGLAQKQYAFHNISDRARSSVNYFSKVISNINEIIIFLFLGISIMSSDLEWHTGFALWAIALCLIVRFILTYIIAFFINRTGGLRKITFPEQFMIAYGGLRGAVCFSLVALLEEKDFPQKNMFVTSSFAVILFTVFVQGISIKPLVYGLRITLTEEKDETLFEELNHHMTDQVMTVLEKIIGDHGHNHLRERLREFDAKYLKRFLLVKTKRRNALLHAFYENLLLREHFKHLEVSGAKTEKPKELNHIDTDLLLSTLAHENDEDDDLSETESTPSSDRDTGYGMSHDSPEPGSAHDRGLYFTADGHHRGSLFTQGNNYHNNHHNNNHHHHHHHHHRLSHADGHHLFNNLYNHNNHQGRPSIKSGSGSHQSLGKIGEEDEEYKIIPAVTVAPPNTVVNVRHHPTRRFSEIPRGRSVSIGDGVRALDLRELLNRNQKSNMNALKARYDPDMLHHGDLPAEIKSKSHTNRRLSVSPGHQSSGDSSTVRRRRSKANGSAPALLDTVTTSPGTYTYRYHPDSGHIKQDNQGEAGYPQNPSVQEDAERQTSNSYRGVTQESHLNSLAEESGIVSSSSTKSSVAETEVEEDNVFESSRHKDKQELTPDRNSGKADTRERDGIDNPAFRASSSGFGKVRIDVPMETITVIEKDKTTGSECGTNSDLHLSSVSASELESTKL